MSDDPKKSNPRAQHANLQTIQLSVDDILSIHDIHDSCMEEDTNVFEPAQAENIDSKPLEHETMLIPTDLVNEMAQHHTGAQLQTVAIPTDVIRALAQKDRQPGQPESFDQNVEEEELEQPSDSTTSMSQKDILNLMLKTGIQDTDEPTQADDVETTSMSRAELLKHLGEEQ